MYRLVLTAGVLAALLLGSAGPWRAVPADALATLHVGPPVSAPGSAVRVTGTGFARKGLVAVWADFRTQSGVRRSTVTVHSSTIGVIDAQLQVPADVQPGTYSVIASDFGGHRASAALEVVAGLTLHVGSVAPVAQVSAGSSLLMTGAGFAPGALSIQATFPMYVGAPVTLQRSAQAAADGSFPALSLRVPYGARSGSVRATDSIGQIATAAVAVQYHPSVAVHPAPIPVHVAFQVNGSGYIPGSRISFTFTRPGTGRHVYSGATTAGRAGRIQTWVHPGSSLAAGTYVLIASGLDGSLLARATVTVTAGPSLSANPIALAASARVVIHGFHFPPQARVRVTAPFRIQSGRTQTVSVHVTAGPAGAFLAALRIPKGASAGLVRVRAQSRRTSAGVNVQVLPPAQQVSAAPATVVAGESIAVAGAGFAQGDSISVTLTVNLSDGTATELTTIASAGLHGTFSSSLDLPPDTAPGSYRVTARSDRTGRTSRTSIKVAVISPSILALPRTAAPGTSVTVTGFGFPSGAPVQLSLGPGGTGTATTDNTGRFFASLIVPPFTVPGKATIGAQSGSASAASWVMVSGGQTTHAYFPSLYTGIGYHEYIALLNPTETDAHVTISYLRAGASPLKVSLIAAAHSRTTRDVNADLGARVSAAAAVTADQPIVAERLMRHHGDVAVDSGAAAPSPTWYFAWGNTSHGYREYLSVENPNKRPTTVAFLFMPAHSRQFTLFKTVGGSSRLTINVGAYVPNDAMSVKVTSSRSIVAGRTAFIANGVSSKTGVTSGSKTWYFAAGPRQEHAVNWISVLNPGPSAAEVSLNAYGVHGNLLATVRQRVAPYAQEAVPVGRIAQHSDVSAVITSSAPVIAEQTTYVGSKHDVTTDAFGMAAPVQSVAFAVMGTRTAPGESDALDIYNPSSSPAVVVLQLIRAGGTTTQRSVVVAPHAREILNVSGLVANAQLGAVLESSVPVAVMNRYSTDKGVAGDTSTGIQVPAG